MEKKVKDRLNELKSLKAEHIHPKLTKRINKDYLYDLNIRISELEKLLDK